MCAGLLGPELPDNGRAMKLYISLNFIFYPLVVCYQSNFMKIEIQKKNFVTCLYFYTPTAVIFAGLVTHMNTQKPGWYGHASVEVGWYSSYQPTSSEA